MTRPAAARNDLRAATVARGEVVRLHPTLGHDVWAEEVAAYMTHLRAARLSPHTLRSYATTLDRFATYMTEAGRSLDPAHATRRDVEGFMLALADDEAAPSTQVQRFVGLSSFFRWLASADEAVIERSPFEGVRRPKLPKGDAIPVIPAADLDRLLATCRGRSFADRRDAAIILLMLSTGARRSEVAGLLVDDLPGDGSVLFHGKGEKVRWHRYGDRTAEAIRHYLRARRDHPQADLVEAVGERADTRRTGRPLFLVESGTGHRGGLTGSGIRDLIARRSREAGIATVHPHQFRHTWTDASLEVMSEGDVMRLGGWSGTEMLRRYGAARAHDRALAHYQDPADRILTRRGR